MGIPIPGWDREEVVARRKMQGKHMNLFALARFPVITRDAGGRRFGD
jgi:hypothetical protein